MSDSDQKKKKKTMMTNTASMITFNKKSIVKRLSREGTPLDDCCINDILKFLTTLYPRRDNKDTVELMLIDSVWVERYMSGVKRYRNSLRPSETKLKSGKIVQYIIPLHANYHWSLLIRVPSVKCWFHFDSLGGYHRKFAMDVATIFDKEVYNEEKKDENEEEEEYEFIYFKDAPKQKSDWECGIYLLMYAYSMIHFNSKYDHEDDPKNIFRYIKKHLPSIDENNRKIFVSSIITLLKNDVH